MNQANTQTRFEEIEDQVVEVLALTTDELALVAGGECVTNNL